MMVPSFTMGSAIESLYCHVTTGMGVICTSQGLIPRAHAGPQYLLNRAHDGLPYDAMLRRHPRATVGASDQDLFGKTIQPALNHIEYTPVAHSCAKETSQLGTGEQQCSRNA